MKGLEQTQNNSEANTTLEKLNAIYLAVYTLISKGSKKEELDKENLKSLETIVENIQGEGNKFPIRACLDNAQYGSMES